MPGVEFDVQIEEDKPSCHIIAIFDDKDETKVKRIEDVINTKLIQKKMTFILVKILKKFLKKLD